MSALARPGTVVIDCAAPGPLAEFYQAVTGWKVTSSDADFAALSDGGDGGDAGSIRLAFARVPGYTPPNWPETAKHVHLDFTVEDLDEAVAGLIEAGARKPAFQPGGTDWVVLTDPEGHPFCVSPA
jgi:predicted enzyme related to lactoylglutathione lyase